MNGVAQRTAAPAHFCLAPTAPDWTPGGFDRLLVGYPSDARRDSGNVVETPGGIYRATQKVGFSDTLRPKGWGFSAKQAQPSYLSGVLRNY
jgi:hypothetical protein